jgi:hypothetical protein
MHDADGHDKIVDPKILAAAKASVNAGGQTQQSAKKNDHSTLQHIIDGASLTAAGASFIPGVGDAVGVALQGAATVGQAALDMASGKGLKETGKHLAENTAFMAADAIPGGGAVRIGAKVAGYTAGTALAMTDVPPGTGGQPDMPPAVAKSAPAAQSRRDRT